MNQRILVFAGSARRASFNRRLAHVAAKMARDAGAEVTLYDTVDYVRIRPLQGLARIGGSRAGAFHGGGAGGAAFNKDNSGKATEPIAASSGVISLKVESLGAKPSMQDDESIRQGLLQGQKNAAYRGSEALRKAATIKDNRSKFY